MYAGHFFLTVGDAGATPGDYEVLEKSDQGRVYSLRGQTIEANQANNPYGKHWIGLGGGVSIHGSAPNGELSDARGSLSLSPIRIEDVYGILSVGSKVTISP